VYQDTLAAIPLYIDVSVLFYKKEFLKKLQDYENIKNKLQGSITWDDFIRLGQRVKKDGKPFFIFQADDFEGLICFYCELLANQNCSIIKNDTLAINTPEAKKSLQLLVDLVNKYKISPKEVSKFRENESYYYFMENEGYFLRGWSSFLNLHKTFYDNVSEYESLGVAPTPHFNNGTKSSVFGGWNLMISKFSKNIPESIKFVQYLISEEAQKIMYEEGGYFPINTKIYSDTNYVNKFPNLKFYEKLLKQGFHRPFLENYTNISDILSYYIHLAIKKELSVDEALNKAEEKIKSQSILIK
ncbi:MAG: extracellular solute-binding protein, partial [Ignavibacteriaceae bacterium]